MSSGDRPGPGTCVQRSARWVLRSQWRPDLRGVRTLPFARTAATLALLFAPASLAADALAAKGAHVGAASRLRGPKAQRRAIVSKHVAAVGLYAVRVAISTRSATRRVVHVEIGALSRRAMTGPRGRATVIVRLAIRSGTLTIRANTRGTKPELNVSLRRIRSLKRRPGGKTRASGPTTPGPTGSTGPTTGPGGPVALATTTVSPAPATYAHVVLVVEESNSGAAFIAGSSYFASLATQGELFTNYHGVSHPSEPNYMALISGATQGTDGSDSCITSGAPSLAGQMIAAGVSVRGYVESGAHYACRHDPFSQFTDAAGADASFSTFPTLLTGYAALPRFSLVIPDASNDGGDLGTILTASIWAQANLDAYAQWAKANNSLLIYVSDENDSDPNYSANQPGENGNDALALAVGAGITPGSTNAGAFDHYSMLRTVEDIFGLGHLGAAGGAADMIAP